MLLILSNTYEVIRCTIVGTVDSKTNGSDRRLSGLEVDFWPPGLDHDWDQGLGIFTSIVQMLGVHNTLLSGDAVRPDVSCEVYHDLMADRQQSCQLLVLPNLPTQRSITHYLESGGREGGYFPKVV